MCRGSGLPQHWSCPFSGALSPLSTALSTKRALRRLSLAPFLSKFTVASPWWPGAAPGQCRMSCRCFTCICWLLLPSSFLSRSKERWDSLPVCLWHSCPLIHCRRPWWPSTAPCKEGCWASGGVVSGCTVSGENALADLGLQLGQHAVLFGGLAPGSLFCPSRHRLSWLAAVAAEWGTCPTTLSKNGPYLHVGLRGLRLLSHTEF